MAGRPRFLCGVVEGFYGRPWSMEQRKLLFQWLKRWGLNCYMYAPKDELKHRLLWREPYTEHEAAQMQSLIEAAQQHDVEFIFAISAGQDMVFSSAGDRLLLQQKLRQVAAMGCCAFALLFDDIDPCMCRADRDAFPSLAQAQASVANEVYRELGLPSIFLFCPTEYCSSLCSPSLGQSRYLLTLGRELLPGIGVIWTGPKVVSRELSAARMEEVERVLQRRPVIWDNLFANDYDCRRVFLGPYTGRGPGLVPRLCGLLLNPNCELQANFVPIHTLGSWFRSELGSCTHDRDADAGNSQGAQDDNYSPQEALELALLDWVAEINQQRLQAGERTPLCPSTSCEGGAGLQPGTAVGQEAVPGTQPHSAAPSGTDQHDPEPCGMAPGKGERKATSVPEMSSGSRTPTGAQQSLAEDRDQLTSGSRASCQPSALPATAGRDKPAETPVADETLHSLGTPMCCSSGVNSSQNAPLGTSDARGGGSNFPQPLGSPQPGASSTDVLQIPPGSRAGAMSPLAVGATTSPVPMSPLTDGVGTSPVLPSPPTDGATTSPVPMSPLADGVGIIPIPIAPLTDGASASPAPTAPLNPEEARTIPMAPLTPEEGTSTLTAPLTPEESKSGPMAPLTLEEARSDPNAPLTLEEVRMLVELFYLPYHHGPQAQRLLEHLQWIRANSPSVGVPAQSPSSRGGAQWRGRARSFQQLCAQTCRLHSRFVRSAGRALLYDLHSYLWDIRNMLLAASAFVLWLDGHLLCDPDPKGTWGSCFGWCQSITAPLFPGEDAEPWVRRGGLFGELQALLPVGNSCDLFYHPPPLFPSHQLYLLRPLRPQDKGALYQLCQEGLDCHPSIAEVLMAHPNLLGDRLLGSFLSLSPEYMFVLEDEGGPCGYAAGALCAEGFLRERDSSWLPAVRHQYPQELGDVLEEALLFFHAEPPAVPLPVLQRFPSLVQLGTAPWVLDAGASRSLAICLLSALKANGSWGVFCQVSATDHQQLSFYSKLGFVELPVPRPICPGTRLLGRLL